MSVVIAKRVRDHASKLGLPHLSDSIDQLAERANTDKMGYLEFLDLVLEEELGVREGRRFRTALRASKLPHHKTLEEFDFTFQPDLDIRKVKDLATLSFVDNHSNIAFLGPPGVGKTHLAVALAVAACRAGYSIYFTSLDDMVRQLATAETAGKLAQRMRVYVRPTVLVLDEVGYLPLDRKAANLVFQLVSRRYEKGSILLTSNKTFGEWGEVFADDVLATAILDRLLHHCDVIPINGPSYRLRNRLTAVMPASTGRSTPRASHRDSHLNDTSTPC